MQQKSNNTQHNKKPKKPNKTNKENDHFVTHCTEDKEMEGKEQTKERYNTSFPSLKEDKLG